ncbi:hypothetical protein [Allobaculum stercoricanis]|uniref:hypothetical protein n=1 Tax=Allobaculum stercoricanis TaxID=174709 RepID=UPI002942636D|nr:hypothetical protein [Allobaculum stercoricanis]
MKSKMDVLYMIIDVLTELKIGNTVKEDTSRENYLKARLCTLCDVIGDDLPFEYRRDIEDVLGWL